MSHTLRQSAHTNITAELFETLTLRTDSLLARIQQARQQARSRKIVSGLTEEQLRDAGIDRSAVLPPRPVIEVDAGLMARLMTMR